MSLVKYHYDFSQIKKLLKPYLEDYKHVNLNSNFKCLNINHDDEHPSMSYSDKYNICKCFACGKTFDIFTLIAQDYNLDPKDYKNILKQIFQFYPIPISNKIIKNKITKKNVEENTENYTSYFEKCKNNIYKTNYLQKRGISQTILDKYNIGYDSYKKVVVFPIKENCYFSRGVNDNRKYNSKGDMHLWNEKVLEKKESSCIIITEGIIDALSLEEVGCNYPVIALNGVTNYSKLLKILDKVPFEGLVVLSLDNDLAGKNYSNQIKEETKDKSYKVIDYSFSRDFKDINERLISDRNALKESVSYFNKVIDNYYTSLENSEEEEIDYDSTL